MKTVKAPPSLRSITEDMLREYCELDQRRLELDRESRQLTNQRDMIGKEVQAALAAAERTEVARGDYRAEIRDGNISVAWKEEFIKALGPTAASDIQNSTPPSKKLTVYHV